MAKIQVHTATSSNGYESFEGLIDKKPYRIGRYWENGSYKFTEDLKGNLTKLQMTEIFTEIDRLRKNKLMP